MWQGLYPSETEAALQARVQFPEPEPKPKASAWAQIGEALKAPYQGAFQGVNQTLRVATNIIGSMPSAPSVREKNRQITEAIDERLRENVEFWNGDPVASTTASMVLQQGSRLLTKVAGYSLAGGVPGAIVGTTVDEGGTGYLEARDKGVDQSTAAKVGAVRGVTAGAGVALPVVGRTAAQTLGLVVLGGPGSFMAEQALTRDILETANYPELAKQYDPTDPLGLTLSIAIPGTIGAAAHAIRVRKPGAAALADSPEHLEAAHVAFRDETTRAATLAEPGDIPAAAAHAEQLRATARALEDGDRIEATRATVEPARAEAVLQEARARFESARPEVEAAAREVRSIETPTTAIEGQPARTAIDTPAAVAARFSEPDTVVPVPGAARQSVEAMAQQFGAPPEVMQMATAAAEALQRVTEMAKRAAEPQPQARPSALAPAEQVIATRPELPVRLDDAGPPVAARDVVEQVRAEAARDRQDSRAFVAAIECALRSGS